VSVVRVESRPGGGWAVTMNGVPTDMFGRVFRDHDVAAAHGRDLAKRFRARLEIEGEDGDGVRRTDRYTTTNRY